MKIHVSRKVYNIFIPEPYQMVSDPVRPVKVVDLHLIKKLAGDIALNDYKIRTFFDFFIEQVFLVAAVYDNAVDPALGEIIHIAQFSVKIVVAARKNDVILQLISHSMYAIDEIKEKRVHKVIHHNAYRMGLLSDQRPRDSVWNIIMLIDHRPDLRPVFRAHARFVVQDARYQSA